MFSRLILFLGTNIAVVVVLGIVSRLFGIERYVGGNITGLLVMAFVFGMAGSFISLALSKTMAKRSTGARVIENASNATESWLLETVRRQADAAYQSDRRRIEENRDRDLERLRAGRSD